MFDTLTEIKTRRKKAGKHGMSFSLKRALGFSSLKRKVAKKTGIPLTRKGRRNKAGRLLGVK